MSVEMLSFDSASVYDSQRSGAPRQPAGVLDLQRVVARMSAVGAERHELELRRRD